MSKAKSYERPYAFHNKFTDNMIKCECGHRVYIPNNMNKQLCIYCGKYIFRTKKDEFLYRTRERMNKK